jgi:hypothetical protein
MDEMKFRKKGAFTGKKTGGYNKKGKNLIKGALYRRK